MKIYLKNNKTNKLVWFYFLCLNESINLSCLMQCSSIQGSVVGAVKINLILVLLYANVDRFSVYHMRNVCMYVCPLAMQFSLKRPLGWFSLIIIMLFRFKAAHGIRHKLSQAEERGTDCTDYPSLTRSFHFRKGFPLLTFIGSNNLLDLIINIH